ncbi:MAG: hypothetical protein ABFD23_02625 [Caldisericales bacterium]|nr:hypothetical protein [bacterium]
MHLLYQNVLKISSTKAVIFYIFLDVLCTGLGMGVPIFNILLGLPTGWFLASRAIEKTGDPAESARDSLKKGLLTSLFTMVQMIFIWWPYFLKFFEKGFDFKNTGIPCILYTPKASLVGWLVLMVIISPFLQMLMSVFGSMLVLAKTKHGPKNN